MYIYIYKFYYISLLSLILNDISFSTENLTSAISKDKDFSEAQRQQILEILLKPHKHKHRKGQKPKRETSFLESIAYPSPPTATSTPTKEKLKEKEKMDKEKEKEKEKELMEDASETEASTISTKGKRGYC